MMCELPPWGSPQPSPQSVYISPPQSAVDGSEMSSATVVGGQLD